MYGGVERLEFNGFRVQSLRTRGQGETAMDGPLIKWVLIVQTVKAW